MKISGTYGDHEPMGKVARRTLRLLIKQKSKCYYCGCKCFLYLKRRKIGFGNLPNNTATIEHIYPNTDIRRLCKGGKSKQVVACYECNNRLGTASIHLTSNKIDEVEGLLIGLFYGLYDNAIVV